MPTCSSMPYQPIAAPSPRRPEADEPTQRSLWQVFARRGLLLTLSAALTAVLTACGGGGGPLAATSTSAVASVAPLRFVATPNPNVFPLLLALARNPTLPAKLVPIADGSQIATQFSAGNGDALLAMTYTAAKQVITGKVPQLQLVQVNDWRGFWMISPQSAGITQFAQLVGKGVLVSGPTSGGQGGGPDLIFQAALRRAGQSIGNFKVCYLPVMQAAPMMAQQLPMNSNPACDPSFNVAPTAISLVEPAATGLVMQTRLPGSSANAPLARAFDIQTLFTGYTAWPQSQLPHGGVAVLSTVLNEPARLAETQMVLQAYSAAADEIMAARSNPQALQQVAQIISAGITTYYGSYGLSLPAPVIAAALTQQELVFRTDLSLTSIQSDLNAFLTEVVGSAPPTSFYRSL